MLRFDNDFYHPLLYVPTFAILSFIIDSRVLLGIQYTLETNNYYGIVY